MKRSAMIKFRDFSQPLSYRVNEDRDRLLDCRNVFSNQGRLESRYGTSRYNSTSLGGAILSVSYFKKTSGTRYVLAKVGSSIYSVATSGSSSTVKTGLTSTTKHRAITLNNRHIIADGENLYFFDGTNFAALGQAVPSAPTTALAAGGSLTDTKVYRVALTFYSSTTGFETNIGTAGTDRTAASPNLQINLTNIPSTATNPTIDKVRIYLKNVTAGGSYLYIDEISLGTTTYSITADSSSSTTPPTTNGTPTSGGAKYMTEFNRRLVVTGNGTYPNDVYFSETDLPDAWDQTASRDVLYISGQGSNSGIATGFYNNSMLEPYIVIFKERSTHIYSERDDFGRLVCISDQIGCVSHDTIIIKNGDIFFLSHRGWHWISNGNFVRDKNGDVVSLSDDIDDIFKSPDYIYAVNKSNFSNFFGFYYQQLDQYFTFVSEGSSSDITKAYVYEFQGRGFKPYEWTVTKTCGCVAEDSSGDEIALFGDDNGYLFKHSIKETQRSDIDDSGAAVAYECFAQLIWQAPKDFARSYNFRDIQVRALQNDNTINGKTWVNYNFGTTGVYDFDFDDPNSGFVLDVTALDEGVFSDGRDIVSIQVDLNRCGINCMVAFYQNVAGGNLNLVSAQMNCIANGNTNSN